MVYIDWFQCYFRGSLSLNGSFSIKKTGVRSKIFATIDEIYYHDRLFGILASQPLSKIIPNNSYILKVENSFLYDENFETVYTLFRDFSGLKYQNITRIDLCFDFNRFENNLMPENLIKKFLKGGYVNKKKFLFKAMGMNARPPVFDYLRFGSGLSELACYLYRKSKEMREVKFKPWIFETWVQNGLDTSTDVWRLEFSIKGGKHHLLNKESGEFIPINDLSMFSRNTRIDLFNALVEKYFKFYHNIYACKIDKLPSIKLFDIPKIHFQHVVLSEHEELNRTAKTFIKQLENLNFEVREHNSDLAFKIMEVSAHVAEKYDLEKYREWISCK